MTKLVLNLIVLSLLFPTIISSAVLKGTVTNSKTDAPIAYATISSSQNSQTIMTNEDGMFILYLDSGITSLSCSHIAYYTYNSDTKIDKDTVELKINLDPSLIMLPSISVYDRNYDAAQAIIIEAIRHKDQILSKLKSYKFDAYTKFFASYESKKDSSLPFMLTETELTAYWKYPSTYKELITARKQSSNIEASENTFTIDEVLNFNNNRVEINDYSFVSPTATDALDFYNYYLLDTIYYDTLPVFLLEVEPKSHTTPLFIGKIQINSQTYEIMGIEFTINEGLDSRFLKELNLMQEFSLFENKHWMPVILKYDGTVDIPIPFIPKFSFAYTAALQRYQFDQTYNDTIFVNTLEVDKNADNFDSTQWLANRFIPLTTNEELAYDFIDTSEFKIPLKLKLLSVLPIVFYATTNMSEIFHFNKVEGAYLGYEKNISFNNYKSSIDSKLGYAIDAKLWQQEYILNYSLPKFNISELHISYQDNIQTVKTINSADDGNTTGLSLLFKHDPYDYYREKGFIIETSLSPFKKTSLDISYNDLKQTSITNNTDYSLFHKFRNYRENPQISEGKLRSLKFDFKSNSTDQDYNNDDLDESFSYPYTIYRFGGEISDSNLLGSDFEFSSIYGQYYTTHQISDIGISSLGVYGTRKLSGDLPQQRFTVMDYGANIFDRRMMFRTLRHTNFAGSDLLSIYYNHEFGRKLFLKSNLPLIKKIPYSLSIHSGIFWSRICGNSFTKDDSYLTHTTNNPYSEIGFSIGRLPMLSKVSCTWQLSNYDTDKFYIGLGFDF